MSASDGDSSSRLSEALDDLFNRHAGATGPVPESVPESPARSTSHDDDTDPTGAPVPPSGVTADSVQIDHPAAQPVDQPVDPAPVSTAQADVLPDIVPATVVVPVVPPVEPTLAPRAVQASPPTAPVPPPNAATTAGPTTAGPAVTAPTSPSVPTRPVAPPAQPAAVSSWGDHMPIVSAPGAGELRASGRRPRVRRVTRVIRHVDPWSVFKVGLIFSLVTYAVMLTSGVLLWRVAESTGSIDNVERWFTQFGWETFEFKGGELFRNAWIIGLFGVVAMTGFLVLLATLFNLVSDIVGGVRVTVLEEEVVERTTSNARRYVVRRPGTAGAVAASNWSVDDEPDTTAATASAPSASTPAASTPASTAPADWSVDD